VRALRRLRAGGSLMKVRTYLNYGGNCAEAFRFYEQNLGAKIGMLMTFAQAPDQSQAQQMDPNAVLHAQLAIGDTQIMASDVAPDRFQPMRSAYICYSVDSDAEAERVYGLLAEGGEVFMPMQETFFASRFGQLRDRFGTSWMVIHERPMTGPA
jgi:PhnB protein